MEGRFLEDLSSPVRAKSYTEYFEEYCPVYMGMGMTHSQYWDDDVEIARYTYKSYMFRREQENYMLWLQGFYVYQAIGANAPIFNAFAKKGTKQAPYLEKPIPITKEEEKKNEEEKQREVFEKNLNFMKTFTLMYNSTQKKE